MDNLLQEEYSKAGSSMQQKPFKKKKKPKNTITAEA